MPAAVAYKLAAIADLGEGQVDGVLADHGLLRADAGEQVAAAPGHAVKFAQGLEHLAGEGHHMVAAHLHLGGWDRPQGIVEVDL
ncbi:hypothetical protein D3C80_2136410 [compost metagenome]